MRGVPIENKVVCLTTFQAKGLNNVVELSKPSTRRLLETIKRGAIYKPNQTFPKQQTREVAPCRPPLLDRCAEKHF